MEDAPGGRGDDRRAVAAGARDRAAGRRWQRGVVVDAIVNHRIEAVFPFLADPTRWHDFAPAVVFRRQIDDGAPRVGTRWMATDRIGPFRIHFVDRLESLEENRSVVWVSSAPWNSRVEYECTDAGGRTRVRADYTGDLSGSLRWQVGWLPGRATHWILAQDFRRLDRLLTLDARAAGRWQHRHAQPQSSASDTSVLTADQSVGSG